jgi:drug/metabolite transporter (DMT)-like permease
MLTNNLIGLFLSLSMYIYGYIYYNDDTHSRIISNTNILKKCIYWGLAGSVGQIFIFFTISLYDCYLLTVITTTRKFFSVVYSNFIFGHNFDTI